MFSKVSDEAKTLNKALLDLDPSQRPTAQLALNSHWPTTHKASTKHDVTLVSEITSIARKKWRSAIIFARVINRFGRQAALTNASSSGNDGWGEDQMNGEISEDDADAEDAGDGETNDRSNQIQASLSLGGINSGSNENVKVIEPDEKGDQLGKRDDSSSPGVSLTGTREFRVIWKTIFSSLATSLKENGVSNRHNSWFDALFGL
ncbi:hypothetical protein AZE42_09462 [Rhizopogon vesiculosus]|uniref:Protein kinase domain-containing protein n=1 Tax=Rhizopogon vesiculosus TaxID=180088 RepID=A0A1J8QGY7_9AGAM|nr:hypothetical protein AZE42_09462 [Rhizopogon vesiculosus]